MNETIEMNRTEPKPADPLINPLNYNQCQEAVRRLHDYLSHELPDAEEALVTHHLQECKGCFSKFHFEKTLLETIHQRLQAVATPGSLRTRVMQMLLVADTAPLPTTLTPAPE